MLTLLPCNKNKTNSHTWNLQNVKYTIQDSEILNQGVQKPNNINSRSFIFIRQKYRSPMLTLFRSQIQNPLTTDLDSRKSIKVNEDTEKIEKFTRRFTPSNLKNAERDRIALNYITKVLDKSQDALLNKLCNSKLKFSKDVTKNKTSDVQKIQDGDKFTNEHREYLELLKTPLLRSNYNGGKSFKKKKDRQMFEVSKTPSNLRNRDDVSKISSNISLAKKHNKEYRPYKSKHTFYTNTIANQNVDRVNVNSFKKNVSAKFFEGNDGRHGKRLENCTQNNLEAKLQEKKRTGHINRSHFCHDCSIKNLNYDLNHRNPIHSDCKCGRHIYLKGRSEWNNQVKQIKTITYLPSDIKLATVKINTREHGETNWANLNAAKKRQPRFN